MKSFLKIHQMDGRSLSWWNVRRKLINLEPSYQRKGRRWSISDKAYLIDSMINGYDLPKFYMVDFTFGGGGVQSEGFQYAVIDGKQRLEAIFGFIDDEFPLSKDFVARETPNVNVAGLKYSQLAQVAPFLKEAFDNYNLTVMGVIAGDEELINEIFIRLNRGRPLNGAELRNAISGPVGDMVREIAEHSFFKENIRFSVSKSQDLNLANKLLKFEVEQTPGDTKKKSLDDFVKKASHRDIEAAYSKVIYTLDDMSEVFLPKDTLLKSEGPIPVYYWCFRQIEEQNRVLFRDYLYFFNDAVTSDLDAVPGFFHESDIVKYRKWLRSVNDKNSNYNRFLILEHYFPYWVQKYFLEKL